MSNAKKCDRCGNFYELSSYSSGYVLEEYIEDDEGLLRQGSLDLCEDCYERFESWMNCESAKESH